MALGGPDAVREASNDAETRSLMKHCFVAIPLTCFFLWFFVGNVARALTPLLTLVLSFLTGQAAVGILAHCIRDLNLDATADSFVLFIDLALCLDYALFFWTRFVQERSKRSYTDSLKKALSTSSEVIIVSNFFVAIAYISTLFFPRINTWGFLSVYIEALVSSLGCSFYTVVFIPALAACLPSIFDDCDSVSSRAYTYFWTYAPSKKSFWTPWSRYITRWPAMVIWPALAYCCMGVMMIPLGHYRASYDIETQATRNDIIETHALDQFMQHFRVGMFSPVTIQLMATPILEPWPSPANAFGGPQGLQVPDDQYMPVTLIGSGVRNASGINGSLHVVAAQEESQGEDEDNATSLQKLTRAARRRLRKDVDSGALGLDAREILHTEPARRNESEEAGIGRRSSANAARNRSSANLRNRRTANAAEAEVARPNITLNPAFGVAICQIAENLMNATRGWKDPIEPSDMLSIWWIPTMPHSWGPGGCIARVLQNKLAETAHENKTLAGAALRGATRTPSALETSSSETLRTNQTRTPSAPAQGTTQSAKHSAPAQETTQSAKDSAPAQGTTQSATHSSSEVGVARASAEASAAVLGTVLGTELDKPWSEVSPHVQTASATVEKLSTYVPDSYLQGARWQTMISPEDGSVALRLFTGWGAFSDEAKHFDIMLRDTIENTGNHSFELNGQRYGVRVAHSSLMKQQITDDELLGAAAPKIFGILVALTVSLIGLNFRALLYSFKLALTVVLPIFATYGMAIFIFQMNGLGWTGLQSLTGVGGLDFRTIYITPAILFGAAMDYDLFLFIRVREYRMEGFDNSAAVCKAFEETGPVVSAAGLLMAISFFAIFMSDVILYRTLGFIFFFGISFDVIVIRTIVAPVFLHIAGDWTYWPSKMPKHMMDERKGGWSLA
jgi:hypothetical protein